LGVLIDRRARLQLKQAGIHVPIIAGIMPITTTNGMKRMADLSGGSVFPARLLKALQRAGSDPEAVRRVGLHYATEQCADLLNNNVSGIHFYTLNQSSATREIYASLGLKGSRALAPA
jgi:methylenetetrahydrofolate reductase (NADPH)